MSPEENMKGSPEDWLRYAKSDLALARLSPPAGVLLESLCFHAQQAAEKALKAVLVANTIRFPKTHSIRMLIDLLPPTTPKPEVLEEAAGLTDYAVISRYPSYIEPIDDEEYHEAIRLSEAVVFWAEECISK